MDKYDYKAFLSEKIAIMYIFGGVLHNSIGKTLMEIMFTYNLRWYFLFTICQVYMIKSQMTRKSFRH